MPLPLWQNLLLLLQIYIVMTLMVSEEYDALLAFVCLFVFSKTPISQQPFQSEIVQGVSKDPNQGFVPLSSEKSPDDALVPLCSLESHC